MGSSREGFAMVSKCANPACSEKFLRLHQGKLFCLSPTPEVEEANRAFTPALYERFWLCDRCSKLMTLVWAGTEARLVPLPDEHGPVKAGSEAKPRRRRKAASAD
jgi:hypothetical protein